MSNDLVPIEQYAVAMIAQDPQALRELVHENLGGEQLSVFDLDQIRVPSGGGTIWQVPGPNGEEDIKELDAIVIYHKMTRAYYKSSIEEGGVTPPDCHSDDCLVGVGDPGGDCTKCPFAQFGTAKGGSARGQACSQKRVLFLLRKDSVLPAVLPVPAKSLKGAKQYLLSLINQRKKIHGVVTRMTLKAMKNADNIKYSEIQFQNVGDVEAPNIIEAYVKAIKPVLDRAAVEAAHDMAA